MPKAENSAQTAGVPGEKNQTQTIETESGTETSSVAGSAQTDGETSAKVASAAKESSTEAAYPKAAKKKIGICIYKFDDTFMQSYRNELKRYLTETLGFADANITISDGKGDQDVQTEQIKALIADGADALVVNLVQPSAARTVTDLCDKAGIPVVYINREPDEAEEQRWGDEKIRAAYIGCDAVQAGRLQGEAVLGTQTGGDINGDGVVSYVMIQGDPENPDAQARTQGAVEALTDAGVQTNELYRQRGDWNQAKGQQLTQEALNRFGAQAEVVFCNNDAMAIGAAQAAEAAGRTVGEDIYILGVDALPQAVRYVRDGKLTATVFNDYFAQAAQAGDTLVQLLEKKDAETVQLADYTEVTPENAQKLLEHIGAE